jgi:ABC-type transport system involved in multi-copper enzyme maturation permease subunit
VNKFIAMLRDSFKEAVDGWIFPVMIGLSTIVILLVASISYTPQPLDEGLRKALQSDQMRFVNSDRGTSSKIGQFFYQSEISDVTVLKEGGKPWESEFRFSIELSSLPFGVSGVEMDNAKEPTNVKKIDGDSDAFRGAVRYWASKPGQAKPAFTDELAKEFLTQKFTDALQLEVTGIEKQKSKNLVDFLPFNKFTVTAKGMPRKAWPHKPALFFGLVPMSFLTGPLGSLVNLIESRLVNGLGAWIVLLAGVIVTAGFIPNMIRKGAIDLLLTKPMARPTILIYKYFGGMFFVILLTAYTILGLWLAVGVTSGMWGTGILLAIFSITFYFSILYAFSTMIGVFTRNAIVCIVGTMVFWAVLFVIGFSYSTVKALNSVDFKQMAEQGRGPNAKKDKKDDKAEKPAVEITTGENEKLIPEPTETILEVLNRITPRTNDVDTLTSLSIARDTQSPSEIRMAENGKVYNWPEVLGVSFFYIAFFLGLALLRFVTRSY